eukprot:9515553-Heterocapsa_arctica.AAC.1
MTEDSGAYISAFPPAMAPGYLVTADDRTGTEYTTASGDPLPDEGQRTAQVIAASGKRATMQHR